MGHANLSNISTFFVRRLYAKGRLSIDACVEAMLKKGVEVRASEGGYKDEGMLKMAMVDVTHYLTRPDPTTCGYSGPKGGGPWIEPQFDLTCVNIPTFLMGKTAQELHDACQGDWRNHDKLLVLADALAECDRGDGNVGSKAIKLRTVATQMKIWCEYSTDRDRDWDYVQWDVFGSIEWKFVPGKRTTYPNGIPILSNVTH